MTPGGYGAHQDYCDECEGEHHYLRSALSAMEPPTSIQRYSAPGKRDVSTIE